MFVRVFAVVVGLALALGLTCATSVRAAMLPFQEAGGRVVVEAEHFDSKNDAGADAWMLQNNGDDGFSNARGQFMRSNKGGRPNNTGPFPPVNNAPSMDFKINISTTGDYQLFIRAASDGGSSDSMYGSIVELQDGAGVVPDFWEFTGNTDRNFDANNPNNNNGSWDGLGGSENMSAADNNTAAIWTIGTPGVYTVRFSRREDGIALDTFLLQLTTLTNPNQLPGGGNLAELPESLQIIPEPSSVVLAVLGLLGLLGWGRRRRRT